MDAAIDFRKSLAGVFSSISSSGVGFYGAGGFGTSVQVSSYQDSTFVTNANGSVNGGNVNNLKYVGDVSGVQFDGGATTHISGLPVASSTLNIRFTFDSVVSTQNGELRVYDGNLPADNGASGVVTQIAQLVNGGSGVDPTTGDAQAWDLAEDGWIAPSGSGTIITLLNSPGSGGLSPNGADTDDITHDWYFCMSASPQSIGPKTLFALFCSLEYL